MKIFLESIVKVLDWLSCIIPNMLLVDDTEPPTNPIEYGMSVLGGLIVCACGAFGIFLIVWSLVFALVFAIASFPIASCSIALVLGLFIGIGYLRKKIGGKLNDN